jgi:hypothetical protein
MLKLSKSVGFQSSWPALQKNIISWAEKIVRSRRAEKERVTHPLPKTGKGRPPRRIQRQEIKTNARDCQLRIKGDSPAGRWRGRKRREIPPLRRPTIPQERDGKKKSDCSGRNDIVCSVRWERLDGFAGHLRSKKDPSTSLGMTERRSEAGGEKKVQDTKSEEAGRMSALQKRASTQTTG